MPDYRAYGGRLRSAVVFPELRASAGEPADWNLQVGPPALFPAGASVLGDQRYAGDVRVRLLRAADGTMRVETSDIGDFDVSADGTRILWQPRQDAPAREDLARFDMLGRVLPIVLHRRGALCLHGSSVRFGDHGAIAILAQKGRGKSTLALALAQHGAARLLSDDVTVVTRGSDGGPLAQPGVHAVRLWEDSAERLRIRDYGEPGAIGRKLVVPGVPEALLADEPAPLRAIYLLSGAAPEDGSAAARHPLGHRDAAMSVVRQATAGGLLGGDEGARVLERVAEVVRRLPVFVLHSSREFERLGEVVATIARWHSAEDGKEA